MSGADAHWQVRGCGSRWDTGAEVSGLKQGDKGSVRRASGQGRGKAGACSLRWARPWGSGWGPRLVRGSDREVSVAWSRDGSLELRNILEERTRWQIRQGV